MARAFLKTKAPKGREYICEKCGKVIEPGTQYYSWKFNFGATHMQHAEHGPPRASQLTNSKMGEVYDAVSDFDVSSCESPEDMKAALQSVADAARSVAEQYGESADNIEASWPSGNPTSEACRNTQQELESWADSLESWEPDHDSWDKEQHDTEEDWLEECRESASGVLDDQPEYQG